MIDPRNATSRAEMVRGWLYSANLSRPIRNLARDLSDAVLVAELIAHFLPRYITLSNFAHVNSTALKRYNWETLQKVVFRHFNFKLTAEQIQALASGSDEALLENVLLELKLRIEDAIRNGRYRPVTRRSRSSTSSSRGGSTLSLNTIDVNSTGISDNMQNVSFSARDMNENGHISSSQQQTSTFNELTHDQLIEKLYVRISQLEQNVRKKNERIQQLTNKIDKLVDIVCQRERTEMRMKRLNSSSPPSTPSGEICDFQHLRDCDSSDMLDSLNATDFKPSRAH